MAAARSEADDPAADAAAQDGRRLRWTKHRAERRAAFVASGADAVDEFGQNASAEQIAETAGVSRTVLYRYFRDREDLRQAIAEHVVRQVLDSVLPTLELSPERTPRQIISGVIGTIIGWLDEHPNLYFFLRSRRDGLESVENTLADSVASLLKLLLMVFGVEADEADPGAHGIVGFVESAGGWWLTERSMPRERFVELVCNGVWHLLEGTARDHGLVVGYDEPLPIDALVPAAAEQPGT